MFGVGVPVCACRLPDKIIKRRSTKLCGRSVLWPPVHPLVGLAEAKLYAANGRPAARCRDLVTVWDGVGDAFQQKTCGEARCNL